ncbi:MAG TPA: hypothetical protein VFQ61_16155 [Polyangiaceae bacterium]|nr:hypothetical protein [Polyangiaceae bacterium]
MFGRLIFVVGVASACQPVAPAAGPGNANQSAASERAPARPARSAVGSADPEWESGWSKRWLARQALTLELPDAAHWRKGTKVRSFVIEHPASHSVLKVESERAERLVRPADCEQRARLAWPEAPRGDDASRVDARRLDVPPGYVTQVEVLVLPLQEDTAEGHVLAFGAAVGRCLALHFTTRASGPERFERIAERLGLVTGRLLPSITPLSADDRVQTEPLDR